MSTIRFESTASVVSLIVECPPLNILGLTALGELEDRLTELAEDETLQLLIVRGSGSKAFSAGVAVEDHTPDKIESMLASFHGALRQLLDFPAPTLAVIDGHCLGGGMELAAACDLRFASEGSRFGQPEIKLGCYPPWAAAHYPELLGPGLTIDLLLTGRTLDAAEALQVGFIDRRLPAEELAEVTATFADQIARHSTAVSRLALRAIRARRGRGFDAALTESERLYTQELTQTDDMNEGLAAFLEKRRPAWKNR